MDFCFFAEKRKEPPDNDTKPSSSVDVSSIAPNSTSGIGKSSKRSRRWYVETDIAVLVIPLSNIFKIKETFGLVWEND